MKKDFIFAPILLVVAVLLGLLKVTGMPAHIIISIVGVVHKIFAILFAVMLIVLFVHKLVANKKEQV